MDYIQYAIEQLEKNNQGISAVRARGQYVALKNRLAQLEGVPLPLAPDACPYCLGTGKGKMNGVEVGCIMCSKTGKVRK